MDSIYGGRPGSPFVIKAQFSSIEEMQEAFKSGPEYKDVWYGEYCIIDTENKNDFDNGKIYQRGTEYGNGTGDAKYVGQVVGPQSGVPGFDFEPLEDVKGYNNTKPLSKGEIRTWPYQNGESKEFYQYSERNQDTSKPALLVNDLTLPNGNFVKGWDDQGNFNDTIKYTWVNIAHPQGDEDSNGFAVSKTLVGFQVPYPVFKVADPVTTLPTGTPAFVRETKKTEGHPFAYELEFGIPKGPKGDSVDFSTESFSSTNNNGTVVNYTIFPSEGAPSKKHFVVNEIIDLYSDITRADHSNHLYALYSSREARENDALNADGFTRGSQIGIPEDNYKSNLNWKDLGAIKDQSGLLVGRDLNNKDEGFSSNASDPSEIVTTLNTNYTVASGKVDGKVCTYRNQKGETWVFAWDYNQDANGWYYVGTFNGGGTKFSVSDGGNNAPKGWYFKKATNVTYTPKKTNWWE